MREELSSAMWLSISLVTSYRNARSSSKWSSAFSRSCSFCFDSKSLRGAPALSE